MNVGLAEFWFGKKTGSQPVLTPGRSARARRKMGIGLADFWLERKISITSTINKRI
jgi:hypothetical protein